MKKKINCLLVFVGFMFVFPLTCNASCDYERQAELSKIASNVQFTYTYDVDKHGPLFDVYLTNLTNDIYVVDNYDQRISGVGEVHKNYPNQNAGLNFIIYSNDNNCKDEEILTFYLNLPSYNLYSTREECKKYPSYRYCALWMNTLDISSDQFEKGLDEYKQKEKTKVVDQTTTDGFWQKMFDILEQYYYILIAIVLLIGAIILKKRLG